MLSVIKEIFSLLSHNQRKRFYILQVLVILMAFTELLGIASIAPFMALVGDMSLLEKDGIYSRLYQLSGINDPLDFLFVTGIGVLIALTLSTVVSMFTTWRLSSYGSSVGVQLADRLYSHYMKQDWQFHASGSSAQLTKQVSTESARISTGIIQPLMQMNAKVVLSIFIAVSILIYNPIVAIAGLIMFASGYLLMYKFVRKALVLNGKRLSSVATNRFRLMNEGFGGIKDVLLLNRNKDFIDRFSLEGDIQAKAQGLNQTISQVPRFFIELLAFGAMIGLVLILIKTHHGDLGAVLPILAVYALACFKLLPALQQIYSSITQIKGNIAAFESVKKDLIDSQEDLSTIKTISSNKLSINKAISLKNIYFAYPNKSTYAVNDVSISIPVNHVIGIVGASGSGKSTLIDIILGLLTPQKGEIYVDNTLINDNNKRGWQDLLGFVPQSIFLSEGSIAENVAFGIPADEINYDQVMRAVDLAHLTELVNELPQGIHTKVGERGVQLSGGQRQRIGIARALYNEADVLIFDEATSALDGITEKIIMDAIHEFTGKKTIIMIAHRLKTVQKCDTIYLMEKGKVIDQGTYVHLVENNSKFREMAKHS
ncbi:ABC transporter ATP-binding protein [Psychrobacter sanguinis]|uniref:ABC transporter ATP-binding protein n=1 Tax=Psychrobacter sanguinis TaxID=861445 RepID=UPI00020C7A1B|nr:ABC transporter ATP-binding protein [Psychrobacter sanguinis]EGK13985.1 ABC superfamily ATP binding cassette transporter, ABC/membrane protein [Psychrobacter sp. 1501(2011)]MCD9150536.1 ABC transporter ATP-binding protein/permease [Psychrobacter sanguinis]